MEPEQRVMLGAPFSRPGKCLSPDLAAWKLPLVQISANSLFLAAQLHKGDGAQLAALHELTCELLNNSGSLEKLIQPEKLSLLQQQEPRKGRYAQVLKFNLFCTSVQQQ